MARTETVPPAHCIGLRLAGDAIEETERRGNRIVDETLLILSNVHYHPVSRLTDGRRVGSGLGDER
jgi:hypothetical protein